MRKNSQQRRIYESVDDKSLDYISKIGRTSNSGNKGLIFLDFNNQ